jgi:zinc D-Ala-D-Ala carboxypeptidase
MDGLAAVQQRVAAIESRFAPPPSARGLTPVLASTSSPVQTTSSFDAIYRSTLEASTPATPALRLGPGQYARLDPPVELLAFGNGRIPAAQLVTIGHGDHRLHVTAARAFRQMEAAARAEGVTFGVISSYRDVSTQERLVRDKGLYSAGGLAAAPGTSNHGWGVSVDLDLDRRAQDWMRENGWRFGFVEDVAREPWHWTYRPA